MTGLQHRSRETPLAGRLCLLGFVLHMVLSDPLLVALGYHYSGDEGAFYEKIHPGTYLILLSGAVLLFAGGNPLRRMYLIARNQMAFAALFVVSVGMFFYIVLRSGGAGTALFLDTHIAVPLVAIVLSYATPPSCRRALSWFIAIAAINAGIGIVEEIGKFRMFTFDPDWPILHEEYFRASALRGHPLNNAMFTSVALFITISRRYHALITWPLVMLFAVALVAFGGRAALAYTILALGLYAGVHVWRWITQHALTPAQILALVMGIVLVPLLSIGALYGLIESDLGARIAAFGWWDKSAGSRALVLDVFDYVHPSQLWFGMSAQEIIDMVARMNQAVPLSDIENPWLLMLLWLGAIVFPFWLAATIAFARRLLAHQDLAAQLAVWGYYVIASTSNSFGRKDSTYIIMVCAVMCIARWRRLDVSQPPTASP